MTQMLSMWKGLIEVYPSAQDILKAVAFRHDMTVEALLSPCRERRFSVARWDAMYELKNTPRPGGKYRSLTEIGRQMGGLDHTSVIHGLRRREELAAKAAAKREVEAA